MMIVGDGDLRPGFAVDQTGQRWVLFEHGVPPANLWAITYGSDRMPIIRCTWMGDEVEYDDPSKAEHFRKLTMARLAPVDRNGVIEECARVAERATYQGDAGKQPIWRREQIAAYIRALASSPAPESEERKLREALVKITSSNILPLSKELNITLNAREAKELYKAWRDAVNIARAALSPTVQETKL